MIITKEGTTASNTSVRYLVGDKLGDWLEEDRANFYGSHDQSWGMLISVVQRSMRERKVNLCTELWDWCQVTKVKHLITLFHFTTLFHVWRQARNPALIRKRQKHILLCFDFGCFMFLDYNNRALRSAMFLTQQPNIELWPKHPYCRALCWGKKGGINSSYYSCSGLPGGRLRAIFLFWLKKLLESKGISVLFRDSSTHSDNVWL